MSRALAIDLGASNGRVTIATFDNGKVDLKEIHRFENIPVMVNDTLYWDILSIFHEIKTGIAKAAADGGFDTIGIDAFGVDFALIDEYGRMIDMPVHYRDARTDDWRELFDRIPKEEIYAITGIQNLQINSVYQLDFLARKRPGDIERAKAFLMIPDLINYFLTGEMRCEYTNASTTQLMDAKTRTWSRPLIEKLGLAPGIFGDIVMPGAVCGRLTDRICEETRAKPADVYCITSHDTASAIAAVPASGAEETLYLSSGTWSLIGTELDEPLLSDTARMNNYANEGGAEGKICFLKNIMGSFLVQESKKQWAREGNDHSYSELDAMCETAPFIGTYIDVDDPLFIKNGNMPARIVSFCEKTGQKAPQTEGEIMRVIYESLALKYRYVSEKTAECTGRKYGAMHIIGGGSQSDKLCRMTANATGMPIYAGPAEATTAGNASVQWIASGELGSIGEARQVIKGAFPQREYLPHGDTDGSYERFLNVLTT